MVYNDTGRPGNLIIWVHFLKDIRRRQIQHASKMSLMLRNTVFSDEMTNGLEGVVKEEEWQFSIDVHAPHPASMSSALTSCSNGPGAFMLDLVRTNSKAF